MTDEPASPLTITERPSMFERIAELGGSEPAELAILPMNIEAADAIGELYESTEAPTVRKLLKNAGLPVAELWSPNQRRSYMAMRSASWIGPTLFISAGLLIENPHVMSVALGVLTNYLTDFFRGDPATHTVRLGVVVERKGNRVSKQITYEGPVSGLATLADAVKRIADE